MSFNEYDLVENSDTGVTVFFKDGIGEQLSSRIVKLAKMLTAKLSERKHKTPFDVIPAYQSLTLYLHPFVQNFSSKLLKEAITLLPSLIAEISDSSASDNVSIYKTIEIPVCYEEEFAPDLSVLAGYCQLSEAEVIEKHTAATYLVHMLGFLPGFLYLGGLDRALFCPRKHHPNIRVPRGAVAIGGEQTGIYPVESPGGWHVIGQTPVDIFSPHSKTAFIAQPLDRIQFSAINKTQFLELKQHYSNTSGGNHEY